MPAPLVSGGYNPPLESLAEVTPRSEVWGWALSAPAECPFYASHIEFRGRLRLKGREPVPRSVHLSRLPMWTRCSSVCWLNLGLRPGPLCPARRSDVWPRGAGANRQHRVVQLICGLSVNVRRRPLLDQTGHSYGVDRSRISAAVRPGRGIRGGSSSWLLTSRVRKGGFAPNVPVSGVHTVGLGPAPPASGLGILDNQCGRHHPVPSRGPE